MLINPTLIAAMHDPERYKKFQEDLELLNFKFPVATIERELSESKGNVSAFLSGKKEPSENFYKKFYEHFDEELKQKRSAPGIKIVDMKEQNLLEKALYEATLSSRINAETGKILAEKVPKVKFTEYDDPENPPVDRAILLQALEFVSGWISGEVKFRSKDEALAELYKNVFSLRKKASEAGNLKQDSQDKD